ncbi:hypothetical protein KSD_39980 [Ktedonobacter sp. SOSP1-85]|nr:hypothetical protein KSD_39980 [Ktedonobacter sp. SOSP1-85]
MCFSLFQACALTVSLLSRDGARLDAQNTQGLDPGLAKPAVGLNNIRGNKGMSRWQNDIETE